MGRQHEVYLNGRPSPEALKSASGFHARCKTPMIFRNRLVVPDELLCMVWPELDSMQEELKALRENANVKLEYDTQSKNFNKKLCL